MSPEKPGQGPEREPQIPTERLGRRTVWVQEGTLVNGEPKVVKTDIGYAAMGSEIGGRPQQADGAVIGLSTPMTGEALIRMVVIDGHGPSAPDSIKARDILLDQLSPDDGIQIPMPAVHEQTSLFMRTRGVNDGGVVYIGADVPLSPDMPWTVHQAGDSRLMHISANAEELHYQTSDQCNPYKRNQIGNYIKGQKPGRCDQFEQPPLSDGDFLLLVSDGITSPFDRPVKSTSIDPVEEKIVIEESSAVVLADIIQQTLSSHPDAPDEVIVSEAAKAIGLEAASLKGVHGDNFTTILFRYRPQLRA